MLTQNDKMRITSKLNGLRVYAFGLPAVRTCPMAGECLKWCYGCQGHFNRATVKNARARNLELSTRDGFPDLILNEIGKVRADVVRAHDTGDYYNLEYAMKWIEIARRRPDLLFYSYTKMVSLFKAMERPSNLHIIYSFGGLEDGLIDTELDAHSRVFSTHIEAQKAGYVIANDNDLLAVRNNKIGLVYHGQKKVRIK